MRVATIDIRARQAHALLVLSLLAGQAAANDVCQPLRTITSGRLAQIEREQAGLSPRLEARTAVDLTLTDSPAAFGLSDTAKAVTLSRAVSVLPQAIGIGTVTDDRASLLFDKGAAGVLVLLSDGRRHLLRVVDGVPRTVDGQRLEVSPLLVKSQAFTLAQGSRIELDGQGRAKLLKGSLVVWDLGTEPAVAFTMRSSARLEETSVQATPPRLELLKPARVLPGGLVRLQVQSAGFDFRGKPLYFCFAVGALRGAPLFSHATTGTLAAEGADGAVFEVRLPTELASAVARGEAERSLVQSFFGDSWLGNDANVRVMAYDGEKVLIDGVAPFVLSNATTAITAGLVVIAALLLMSALFVGTRNPLTILDRLARHPSQRYSLSNVQVLMWTLLVIFALCYVWVANGILLTISAGVLALLGISGTTSVLARTVEGYGVTPPASGMTHTPKMKDLLVSEDGEFDLLRFQMLGFTLFTWAYSLISVIRSEGLPEIPQNMYLLMGISNAAYIGGKIASNVGDKGDSATLAAGGNLTLEFERAMGEKAVRALQADLGIAATGTLDDATRQAVQKFKLEHGIVPANSSVNQFLVDKISAERSG